MFIQSHVNFTLRENRVEFDLYTLLKKRIADIQKGNYYTSLKDSKTGLEKESLRVSPNGRISQKKHPSILGAALTHPQITTDYSEALLELITPPCKRSVDALDYLLDIETFVYQQLDDELLWTTSMPCAIKSEDDIQIADYGSSNAGKMKSVYRNGLAWRYGKMMQVIAGIHFNYSISQDFWPVFKKTEGYEGALRDFIDDRYMAMTRNIQRYGWLISYLFGSSPAICKTFLGGLKKPVDMEVLNDFTYYEADATSLRMGDIGYTNRKESKVGVKANYNSLDKYTDSLGSAITTPCPKYQKIGVKVDGEYRQLNANALQIENEYYSSVRPKQVLQGFEKPVDALRKRGVEYVELRSLDINPYHPAGMTREQLFFLEVFMLFCLLQESPRILRAEGKEIDINQSLVAHKGRKPGLVLTRNSEEITLKHWASDLMQAMVPVAELLGQVHDNDCFQHAVSQYAKSVEEPEQTPSAKMLEELVENEESFFNFAQRKAREHRHFFAQRSLTEELQQKFECLAKESLQQQAEKEAADNMSFDGFLQGYFEGTL